MIDPGRGPVEEGPGEGEISTGALAFPGVPGMSGGTPVTIISGLPNQAKGAQTAENSYVFGPIREAPALVGAAFAALARDPPRFFAVLLAGVAVTLSGEAEGAPAEAVGAATMSAGCT
jgi:hypothetical protein